MKRKTILVFLLIFIPLALSARVSLEPNLSLSAGGTFTAKTKDIYRSSYSIKGELDPFCININEHHFISFPTSFTYVSHTVYYNYYCLNSHMDFGVGIGYRYRFTDLFSLKGAMNFAFRYVPEVNGGLFQMDLEAIPYFHFNDYLALTVPVKLGFSKAEFSISPSVGICYIPFGGRR